MHTPLLILLALSVPISTLSAGVVFTDTFSGSGSPDSVWVTDPDGDSTANATVNVSGGALNVNTGNVNGLEVARHTLELDDSGAPSVTLASDWTIEADLTIAGGAAFSTIEGGEGVGVSLGVRNNSPGENDRAQINFVIINFGSGPIFAVRGAHQTGDPDAGGSEDELITPLGDATAALSPTVRISYDAGSDSITMGMDTGAGFFELVSSVDTSMWAMAVTDPLLVQFEMGLIDTNELEGATADSTFSIEDGEATVNEFTIFDETLDTNTIPEPGALLLSVLGLAGLVARRRR